jgi:hypothetical protein
MQNPNIATSSMAFGDDFAVLFAFEFEPQFSGDSDAGKIRLVHANHDLACRVEIGGCSIDKGLSS